MENIAALTTRRNKKTSNGSASSLSIKVATVSNAAPTVAAPKRKRQAANPLIKINNVCLHTDLFKDVIYIIQEDADKVTLGIRGAVPMTIRTKSEEEANRILKRLQSYYRKFNNDGTKEAKKACIGTESGDGTDVEFDDIKLEDAVENVDSIIGDEDTSTVPTTVVPTTVALTEVVNDNDDIVKYDSDSDSDA